MLTKLFLKEYATKWCTPWGYLIAIGNWQRRLGYINLRGLFFIFELKFSFGTDGKSDIKSWKVCIY